MTDVPIKEWLDLEGGRDGRPDLRTAALVGVGALLAGGAVLWSLRRRAAPPAQRAPAGPGADPRWSPSDKAGIGTAVGPSSLSTSLVWFTLGHGGLTEVFYPRLDQPCIRDLALVVTDGQRVRLRRAVRRRAPRRIPGRAACLAYRLINTCKQGRYRIEKTDIAHPHQDAVVQRIRFTPLRGTLEDYRLYALLNPHLGLRRGVGSTGWVGRHKGRTMLFAERGEAALALACSAPWAGLLGGLRRRLRRLARPATARPADPASTAAPSTATSLLTGEVDLARCGGEFVLVLGFGPDARRGRPPRPGRHAATTSRASSPSTSATGRTGSDGCCRWRRSEPGERDLYRTSTAVLRVHEGKTVPGAIIASLSIPWGQAARGDEEPRPGRLSPGLAARPGRDRRRPAGGRVPATTPGGSGLPARHPGGRRPLAPEHVGQRRDLLVGHPARRDGPARPAGRPAAPRGRRDRRRARRTLADGPQGGRLPRPPRPRPRRRTAGRTSGATPRSRWPP